MKHQTTVLKLRDPGLVHFCDGHPWLPTLLHVGLTKTQEAGYTRQGFFFLT